MKLWFLVYTYPLPPPGELMVYVLEDGRAELTASGEPVGFTAGHHGEIGNYSHDFGAETGRRLRPLVEAAVAESPDEDDLSTGPIYPGTPLLSFGFGSGQKPKKLVGFPLDRPLPAAMRQFNDEMSVILRELLRHPVRTIRGSAVWDPKAGGPGAQLALTVRIVNTGKETVEIANPAAAKQGDWTGLKLGVYEDNRSESIGWGKSISIEFLANEIRDLASRTPGPLAVLDPGQSLNLEVTARRQAYLSPGRYGARMYYESGSKKANAKRAVDGMLEIVIPTLVVRAPAR